MTVVMLITFVLHISISTAVSGAPIDGQLRQKLSLFFSHPPVPLLYASAPSSLVTPDHWAYQTCQDLDKDFHHALAIRVWDENLWAFRKGGTL